MKNVLLIVMILPVALFLIGCDRGQIGLSGRVVYSDDGQPLDRGVVLFETNVFSARGFIKEDGRFTMGSFREKDGLPPGTYKVAITGAIENLNPDKSGFPIEYFLIDPKYFDSKTSEITLSIDKSTRDLEIRVDRNPKPRPKVRR